MSDTDQHDDADAPEDDAQEGQEKGPETGPVPERPTDKAPHPSKGATDRVGENVQKKPEDQRNTNNPEHR